VDGLGELPGLPRAAAEFTQDAPGFELGVGAFAGAAQRGVGTVGGLLGGGLVPALAGVADVITGAGVASPASTSRSGRGAGVSPGGRGERLARQRQRGRVEKHRSPLAEDADHGRSLHLPGASLCSKPTRRAWSGCTGTNLKIRTKKAQGIIQPVMRLYLT